MSTAKVYLSEAPPISEVRSKSGYVCKEMGGYIICAPSDVLSSVPNTVVQWVNYFVNKGRKPPFTINFGDIEIHVYPSRQEAEKEKPGTMGWIIKSIRSGVPAPSTIVTAITSMLGIDTANAVVSFLIRRITTLLVPTAVALLYVTNIDGRKVVLHTSLVYLGTSPGLTSTQQQSLQQVIQRIKVGA